MLAIVCGCEKFDQFVYGRKVTVETDHKPLVSIALKPIHNSPKRLQRMLLQLQRYDLNVTYKRESEMYLADALSRAYPAQSVPLSSPQSEFCHSMEVVDLTNTSQDVSNKYKRPRTRMLHCRSLSTISCQAGQMIRPRYLWR